ncbi:hypothetical protein MOQ_008196 [Trypanosoma cruzi marinkellei]|uniref:Uncharacterized protein n=1 Tax=Trypanosoma cruzi marinkellei TaxID=85056 RepID=K2MR20_TRYCR|nr:hypothetical protein MOQ_008196 [Trypanosoma cruzi marinkellei]
MAHAELAEEEIAAIRRELDTLKLQISTTSLDSSHSSLDGATSTPKGGGDDASPQGSVDGLIGRLAHEQQRTRQLEKELQALRMSQKQTNTESQDEIGAKQEELDKLMRERDELREWLQRGVNECRRVAEEASRLKRELEERTRRCQALETAKEELQGEIDKVQRLLTESQSQIERLQQKQRLLEASAGEHVIAEKKLMEMNEEMQKHYETLVAEAESHRLHAERLEDAGMCVQLLTERLRQLLTHVERLQQAVRKGCIEDVAVDEFFSRENVAEPQHPLDELVARAKSLPHTIAIGIQQLQENIVAFVAEQRRLRAEQAATQQEHLEALHLEKQTVLHKYEKEKETLMQEIAQLRGELLRVLTKNAVDDDESPDRQQERIIEIEELLKSNNQQAEENERLRNENEELRQKLRRMKIDWRKVHESQLRFQELQVEVDMIARTNEKIQRENENLKMLIETRFGQLPSNKKTGEELHDDQRYSGVNSKERGASLMRPTFSTIMVNSTADGRRGSSASPSASYSHSRRSAEREVFQEWKRMVLSGYIVVKTYFLFLFDYFFFIYIYIYIYFGLY